MLGIYGKVDNWKEIVLSFSQHAETGKVPPKKGMLPGHKDGWGMSASDSENQSMVILARHPGSAAGSKLFEQTLADIEKQPTIFVCHLRKASPGIPVTPENVHPFSADGFGFIHNGTIYQADSLPRDPSLKLTSDGSDAEYFFHYLLSQLKKKPAHLEIAQSIADAISKVNVDYTAVNSILSNGRELFVIRRFKKHPGYYTLYTYAFPRGIVISSEPIELDGLDPDRWEVMENDSILKIDGKHGSGKKYRIQ
jgi:predicted glutamine amidotransferase